jgi:hypothetical protein
VRRDVDRPARAQRLRLPRRQHPPPRLAGRARRCRLPAPARPAPVGGGLSRLRIASKPFCALFAVSLGARYAIAWWRARRRWPHRARRRGPRGLIVIVALSAAALGGPSIWIEYGARIHLNLLEKYYAINYSFRDVFLQLAHAGPAAALDWTPAAVAASLPEVEIGDFAISFALVRAAMLALLVFVISRHDDEVFAFGMGAFFVYVVFVTNMYYWQMLLLPAIAFARGYRRDWRKLVYLLACCLFLVAAYLFARSGSAPHLEGFVGSWMLASFCAVLGLTEAIAAVAGYRPRATESAATRAARLYSRTWMLRAAQIFLSCSGHTVTVTSPRWAVRSRYI